MRTTSHIRGLVQETYTSLAVLYKQRLRSDSPFLRNVVILTASNTAAQVLLVIVSPFLTRLYLPSQFGLYSTYLSVLGFGLVISSLRYDTLIITPKDEKDGYNVLFAASTVAIIFSLTAAVGLVVFLLSPLSSSLSSPVKMMLPFVPLSLLFGAILQIRGFWAMRRKELKTLGKAKFTQAAVQAVSSLIGGFFFHSHLMLVFADITGRFSGLLSYRPRWTPVREILGVVTLARVRLGLRTYGSLAMFSTSASIINNATIALTPLLLLKFAGPTAVGLFALVDRLMGAPSALLSGAIGQAFFTESSHLRHDESKGLMNLFQKIMMAQFMMGVTIATIFFLVSPFIFGWVFGSAWQEAGNYARIMMPTYVTGFMSASVSMTLISHRKQHWQLIWDIARLISVGTVFAIAFDLPIQQLLIGYSATLTVFYIAHIVLCMLAIKRQRRVAEDVRNPVRKI